MKKNILLLLMLVLSYSVMSFTPLQSYSVDEFKQLNLSDIELSYGDFSELDSFYGLLLGWTQQDLVKTSHLNISYFNVTVNNRSFVHFSNNVYYTYDLEDVPYRFFISDYVEGMDEYVLNKTITRQEVVNNQTKNRMILEQKKLNGDVVVHSSFVSYKMSFFQRLKNLIGIKS